MVDCQEIKQINSCVFASNGTMLEVAHDTGYRVYLITNPAEFQLVWDIAIKGGVKLVRYLANSQTMDKPLAAFVGTGANPDFPSHKLVFWDCNTSTGKAEYNFNSDVRQLTWANTA